MQALDSLWFGILRLSENDVSLCIVWFYCQSVLWDCASLPRPLPVEVETATSNAGSAENCKKEEAPKVCQVCMTVKPRSRWFIEFKLGTS